MQQIFKGVVWPRQSETTPPIIGPDNKPIYRYAVVGVVCTSEPLTNINGETALFGHPAGLAEALDTITQAVPAYQLGTADSVLCSLDTCIVEAPYRAGTDVAVWMGGQQLSGRIVRSVSQYHAIVQIRSGDAVLQTKLAEQAFGDDDFFIYP